MKFMQIKPQKARGVLEERMWTDPQWVAEEKFDGDRRIAQFWGTSVRFTGTRESVDGTGFVEKTDNLPHLHTMVGWNKEAHKLEGTVLDGEIIAPFAKNLPGGKSKYVTAIMGSKPERAIELQKQHGWLEYMVFDCLWYCGEDLRDKSLTTRRVYAARVVDKWANHYAKLVPQWPCAPSRGALKPLLSAKERFEQILAGGGEGVILKHAAHVYGDEKLWVKVKGEWTADVVVMGFTPGKGKYAGSVGAIIFGQYRATKGLVPDAHLEEMGTCSGFDDALRGRLGSKDIGKVIEICHNGREPTRAFRHPRFKRFRPDKSPKDCVYREGET